ncbi:MAG: RNA polymerase sigma factor [Pelotomaculum sp. PtaU1.Bin035]|nr:MAG: RNA polymerase sigma factor [Pelotomaculum sp. PtaU1.Bin035]
MYSKEEIINAIKICLNEEEKRIIESRFGICMEVPLTIKEVCGRFNITNKELRSIEQKVIYHLRKNN